MIYSFFLYLQQNNYVLLDLIIRCKRKSKRRRVFNDVSVLLCKTSAKKFTALFRVKCLKNHFLLNIINSFSQYSFTRIECMRVSYFISFDPLKEKTTISYQSVKC